jgi:hypothetical protein
VKPTAPGLYSMNGRPCLVGMHKGVLIAGWVDETGTWQRAKVWSTELKDAKWASVESK